MTGEIAVGVPMFSRDGALDRLLASIPAYVPTVYVADNGADQDRALYERDWPFDLEVLHLPHDCGNGQCRAALVEAVDEPYLWMGDSDMEFTSAGDLRRLRTVVESEPGIGAAAGWLIEDGSIRSDAFDFEISGDTVVKTNADPTLEGDSIPYARFEYIPQAAVFDTAVFETHSWDRDVPSDEHSDFMLAHRQADAWDFASTPAVMIRHNRNIDEEYRENKRRRHDAHEDVLAEKWGLTESVKGIRSDWGYWPRKTIPERVFELVKRATPPRV